MRRLLSLTSRVRGLALFGLVAAVGTAGLWGAWAAELGRPQANDRMVTRAVLKLLRRDHISGRSIDDEVSQRTLSAFLKSLDPMKVYFYKSDIEEFERSRNALDDALLQGDITFAYKVFDRFLQRVDERLAMAEQILAQPLDFAVEEQLVRDPDAEGYDYASTAEEAADRWRKRLKRDLLDLKSEDTVGDEARQRLRRRYGSFASRMRQTSSDELLERYLTAMTMSLDPHTTYMSATTLENFEIDMRKSLDGIGAALQMEDGQTTISRIIPGGAADRHGKLKAKDRIVSVGQGETGEMVDVTDMKLNDVVAKIRGPRGSLVRLGVVPADGSAKKIYSITRDRVELKESEARQVIIDFGRKRDGSPLKIGVINLPSFYLDMKAAAAARFNPNLEYKSTSRDVRRILEHFNQQRVDAVVLDLRRNGGGSLTEAIHTTGLFIKSGPVVQVKNGEGDVDRYDDLDRGIAWSGPLVVATSKLSASASEILAGAIQDYRRGLIVGDSATHGKGTVQSLLDVGEEISPVAPPKLGALKVTVQQFYRPSGESTQQRGVLADIELPSLANQMDIGESDLDYALPFDRLPRQPHDDYRMASEQLVKRLQQFSAGRVQQSEGFQKLLRQIKAFNEQKARKTISLNEEKFFERRKELNLDEEEEKLADEGSSEVFTRDYYNDELLAITQDYVHQLSGGQR